MAILLLGESFPFRGQSEPFHSTQGRLLADVCGLSLDHLLHVCDAMCLIPTYVPCWKHRKKKYTEELQAWWKLVDDNFIADYDIVIVVGRRIMKDVIKEDVPFFSIIKYRCTSLACIPNPLAKVWWLNSERVKACHDFMGQVLKKYA